MEFSMRFRRDAVLAMTATLAGLALFAPTAPVRAGGVQSQYQQVKLDSDVPGLVGPGSPADTDLFNPWGMAYSPTGPFWVADNGSGVATIYNGEGAKQGLVVTVAGGGGGPANPTGQIYNGAGGFDVSQNGNTGSSVFILDGEDGGISGWSPTVNGSATVLAVDNSSKGAVYKGLEIVGSGSAAVLLATNLNSGWVEEYDTNWNLVGSFRPTDIPNDFAPFGIRDLNGVIYVTFAKQNAAKNDEDLGPSLGIIETLNPSTGMFSDFNRGGKLNAPWGLAIAPSTFGSVAGDLLVGQFGSGQILALDPTTGAYKSTLMAPNGKPVCIFGLWGLDFGNNGSAGPSDWLYYTAGRFNQSHGLFGYLIVNGGV